MSTALQLGSLPTSEIRALVASGRLKPAQFAEALLVLPAEDASAHLQSLPLVVQSGTVRAVIGAGSEAALLPLMRPEDAAVSVMIDTSMFEVTSMLVDMMRAGLEEVDYEAIREARARRTVTIVTPKGEEKRVPVYVNPERALIYFQTVVRSTDRRWRNAVLKALGRVFLAYLFKCIEEGTLGVEEDEWDDCWQLTPEGFRDEARALARRTLGGSEELERQLIARHAKAMREAFRLPEDFMAGASRAKADDLAAELDLG